MDIFKDIESQIVPKYRNYYVSYRQLNEAVEVLKGKEASRGSTSGALLKGVILPKDFTFGDTTAIQGLVEQRPEVRFASLLQHEISKLNHFTALEVKTMLAGLRQQERRLSRILSGEDALMNMSRQVFPSMVDESEASLPPDDKIRLVFQRLLGISEEMLVLEHYVKLNIVIIKRVMDRFDKEFGSFGSYMSMVSLLKEPFCNLPLEGLFTIVARLFSTCGIFSPETKEAEETFSVQLNSSLRAKLMASSILPIQRPPSMPESLWNESKRIPLRSDDLSHEWMKSSSEQVTIVCSSQSFSFMNKSHAIFTLSDSGERISKQECLELMSKTNESLICFHYSETRFGENCRLLENIRICKEGFDFESVFSGPDDFVDVMNVGAAKQSNFTRVDHSVVISSSKLLIEKLSEFISPLPSAFSLPSLKGEGKHDSSTFSVPLKLPSPLFPVMRLPLSPKLSIAVTSSQAPTQLIYPKNFMANERSVLAWISAVSVQAGIGMSFLTKPGVSLIGGLVALISLVFLWWAIYLFVLRYRKLGENGDNRDNNGSVFYSMKLPTAFGVTQMAVLSIQFLVLLFL